MGLQKASALPAQEDGTGPRSAFSALTAPGVPTQVGITGSGDRTPRTAGADGSSGLRCRKG
ncbi:hypothetical protein GCM10009753_55590 [Streptantibioticus ferralitis]